jgi:hypothetical protein
MERERWEKLYRLARELGKGYQQGVRYSVVTIVGVFLWAVVHDRPVCWACQGKNWPASLRIGKLPSQSTMSRRLQSPQVRELLAAIEQAFRQPAVQWVKSIDSKPLGVSAYSKDRDAKWGRANKRQFMRGYKLHAINDGQAVPTAWGLEPMSTHDASAARKLVPHLTGSGYLLGDSQYDSNPLYDLVARHQHQLVAPKRYRGSRGLGHQRHSPWRLHSLELQQHSFGEALTCERDAIERCFGGLTSFGGGLAPLPSWVRGTHRVSLWVHAKILVNALRILDLNGTMTAVA